MENINNEIGETNTNKIFESLHEKFMELIKRTKIDENTTEQHTDEKINEENDNDDDEIEISETLRLKIMKILDGVENVTNSCVELLKKYKTH